ncbi:hypothetical protein BV22DRAFT_50808 [Leucogyrophana mollusca]|uniref:Uncharacterized protein n=1 Tax=Leucogyrophana mollusca TaxID=85980 RepID=A0ACB8BYH5_9AGAM|nr:hypothetical protein BV22DRAFT_50808 [Leucogyrophana mollusca]
MFFFRLVHLHAMLRYVLLPAHASQTSHLVLWKSNTPLAAPRGSRYLNFATGRRHPIVGETTELPAMSLRIGPPPRSSPGPRNRTTLHIVDALPADIDLARLLSLLTRAVGPCTDETPRMDTAPSPPTTTAGTREPRTPAIPNVDFSQHLPATEPSAHPASTPLQLTPNLKLPPAIITLTRPTPGMP